MTRPLQGLRVVVTRAEPQASALARRLADLGADARSLPVIRLLPPENWGPLDRALDHPEAYDWAVFTSASGVRFVLERMRERGLPPAHLGRVRLSAVGPATARALERAGLRVEAVPQRFLTTAIADALGEVAGRSVLLLRADIASPDLPRLLQERGARVETLAVYRTRPADLPPERVRSALEGADAVLLASPSAVRALADLARRAGIPLESLPARLVCIGPVTARAVEDLGLTPHIVADEHTEEGLLRALLEEVTG